jgi:radical SAM protein with 4Fe4S-binding SPASM domain
MFSKEDLDTLHATGAHVGWRCNPILDIDLQGDVIHCFPLSRLGRLPLTPEMDAAGLRSAFEERTQPYRQVGVFKECSTCPLKAAGECSGGCLATTIRRFRSTPFHLNVTGRAII